MTDTPELSRPTPLDRIGLHGLAVEIEATEAERLAVAARLGIIALPSLACRYVLRREPADPAVVLAEAELSAAVVQACVVTLEPFEAPLRERFQLRFVPDGTPPGDDDPESIDEVAYAGTAIDLGEATTEQLALALDPFPRSPDAAWPEPEPEAAHPVAALAGRLRRD